jgi:hypothetical protein
MSYGPSMSYGYGASHSKAGKNGKAVGAKAEKASAYYTSYGSSMSYSPSMSYGYGDSHSKSWKWKVGTVEN